MAGESLRNSGIKDGSMVDAVVTGNLPDSWVSELIIICDAV